MPVIGLPRSRAVAGQAYPVIRRVFVALELDASARRGLFEQPRERPESIIRLVESRVAALQRLLHHRAPDLVFFTPFGDERLDRVRHEIDRLLPPLVIVP